MVFTEPMQPWPGLEAFSQTVHLPRSELDIFFYDARQVSSPALLMVHGLGDEADTWRYLIPELAKNWRVIAPDLPGFGRSAKPKRKYDLAFFEQTMLELLQVLGVQRAVLLGHSLGAAIVHELALVAPERAVRLVLIGGGLAFKNQRLDLATMLFIIPGVGEWLYNRLRRDPQRAYRTLEPYYAALETLPEADRQFLFQRVNQRVWSNGQRDAFLATLRALARQIPRLQEGLEKRLQAQSIPTTILWGAEDRVNSIENGHYLAEHIPQSGWVVVPQAGHNLQQEQPQAILEILTSDNVL